MMRKYKVRHVIEGGPAGIELTLNKLYEEGWEFVGSVTKRWIQGSTEEYMVFKPRDDRTKSRRREGK